jgi:endonuclease/exonuclease/phosphatase (EEP) superfamily protein YafD
VIVLAVPAATLAALTIAAFAGRWVWWLDILANFRAQYIPVLLILGATLMAARWRRTGTAVLLAAGINLVVVLPLFVGSPGEPTFGAPTVRVMTFNLLSANQSYSEVFSYLDTVRPDLVLLHESSHPWEVAADAADTGYQVIRTQADELIFGTLVLVRGGNVQVVSHGFAVSQPRSVEITFTPEGWDQPLRVLSTHTVAPIDRDRAAARDEQMQFAADWAKQQEGPYLVAGDLNSTPWSWSFRNLLSGTDLRNSQSGFGIQPTYSADYHPLVRIPIDHVLVSSALGVRDRQLGPTMASDHYPVIVDLELRG